MTPEQQLDLRQRILRGERVSTEELREAIAALRNRRLFNAEATVAKAERKSAQSSEKSNLASIIADVLGSTPK